MVVAVTRMIASPGPALGRGTSSTEILPRPLKTTARIVVVIWRSARGRSTSTRLDMAQHAQDGPRPTHVFMDIPDALRRKHGGSPGFRRSGSSSGTKFGLLAEWRSTTTVSEQCSILFIKT